MQKLFFFDLETTGLNPMKCAIHQIAGKVIVDGKVKEDFNIHCRPFAGALVDDYALEVAGVTKAQIMGYPPMKAAYSQLLQILDRHVQTVWWGPAPFLLKTPKGE